MSNIDDYADLKHPNIDNSYILDDGKLFSCFKTASFVKYLIYFYVTVIENEINDSLIRKIAYTGTIFVKTQPFR